LLRATSSLVARVFQAVLSCWYHIFRFAFSVFPGGVLRKLAFFTSVCVVALAAFAQGQEIQQIDIGFSGGTLFSAKPTTASLSQRPPGENGGVYPGFNIDGLLTPHLGIQIEGSFRYHKELYSGYQYLRPVFYDANALYLNKITPKTRLEVTAGAGLESLLFYGQSGSCGLNVCAPNNNSNHFLVHVGGGVRYYFLHRVFVRPEANLYQIINNHEFNSGTVLRLGATIGFSFNP
jgi:hypothetical protein